MLLLPGSVCNEFCQASSEQRVATKPNLSRGKAHLSSWDDKPGAIQKQIAQLPHCEALWGSRLRAGNRHATDFWCYTGKRRRRRNIKHINLCRWCLWPAIALQLYAEPLRDDKQQRTERNLKRKHFCFVIFCFQALGWAVLISHPHFS